MPLTQQQIRLVQESFAKVEPIADEAAKLFYDKLFEYAPDLRPLFKKDMAAQRQMLMSTLKLAVKGLDDLEQLTPVLRKLAQRHVDYGVKPGDYTPVGNALLWTLKQGLGEASWTQELRAAWVDAFRLMATVMKQAAYPEIQPIQDAGE
ncbi:Hemoglobin-like flavoprotein [Chromobacterium violaceum]|uniref:Hemin receptor n=2 Tax=Chromobacterium violaceum TaxID=536 RepID=A0A202BE77_CHRVL|nr:globin family protein [Chromobacterium violaceum]AAQ60604.1 probable bacterial hemoglobin [Chromobacterium violaceum ATCC 12472]ATP29296.1 hemin receptor [Chromobacterium violaceum]ATP33203.1 hemin receptor [Chromobacterium violaceum]KJH68367.1 hemin receptor [Chromobacterium violaceum]MBA8736502.1 hemin receptor [Chromobacterium violaceum]